MPGSLRILVADDEPDMLELLRVNLEVEGHVVLLAADGNEALSLAMSGHPDLIVLDVMMPGMDGLEVLRTLRSQPGGSEMAIVLLSARGSDPEIFEGWQSGANYYITKPFDIQELLDFIEQVEAQPENLAAGGAAEAVEDPVAVASAASPVIQTNVGRPSRAGIGPAGRVGGPRVLSRLPAVVRATERECHRSRGADPLAAPHSWDGAAARLHPVARRDRTDDRGRRLGPPRCLHPSRDLA